jgi:hypothetical protein
MGTMAEPAVETQAITRATDTGALTKRDSGVMALAMMSEADFEARLVALKLGQDRIRRIQRELLNGPTKDDPEGEDYGVIPGTKKPTLFKAGAEKVCNVYGLVPSFHPEMIEGDGVTTPTLRCRMKCLLHRGDTDGPVIGEGLGAANTWEKKHRYRGAERACPSCGCEGTIRRSTFEKNGDRGWYCHAKAGGCGDAFASDDPAITEQQRGQVENPDPYDVENTILKMAKKRAHVDAVLTATATSGLFTQDVEEFVDRQAPPPAQNGHAPAQASPAAAEPVHMPPSHDREPGADDDVEWLTSPDAHARHGVAPAVEDPPRQQPTTRQAAPARNGGGRAAMPGCPKGHPPATVMLSKRGSGYYCHECREGFGAGK